MELAAIVADERDPRCAHLAAAVRSKVI